MIECQVTQGCEVGITVRHNGNVGILRLFYFCFHSNLQPNSTCVVAHSPLSHGPLNPDSRLGSNLGSTQMCVHMAIIP